MLTSKLHSIDLQHLPGMTPELLSPDSSSCDAMQELRMAGTFLCCQIQTTTYIALPSTSSKKLSPDDDAFDKNSLGREFANAVPGFKIDDVTPTACSSAGLAAFSPSALASKVPMSAPKMRPMPQHVSDMDLLDLSCDEMLSRNTAVALEATCRLCEGRAAKHDMPCIEHVRGMRPKMIHGVTLIAQLSEDPTATAPSVKSQHRAAKRRRPSAEQDDRPTSALRSLMR